MSELASYLFVKEFKHDENAELTPEQLLDYEARAFKIRNSCFGLIVELKKNRPDTEEDIATIVYNIGKLNYGESKESLRAYFKDLYLVLFQKTQGTRINTYIKLLGIEDFSKKLEKTLQNPFTFLYLEHI